MPFKPPPIAFCNKGLAPGENGDPDKEADAGLPLPDNGELEYPPLLPGEPLMGVGVLLYLGGVTYCEPGVGGVELGGRPRSFRCAGVRAMSEISSKGRKSGKSATITL